MNLKTIMSKAVLENMSSGAAQAIKELDDNALMSPKELESYLTQRFTPEEIMATGLFDNVKPERIMLELRKGLMEKNPQVMLVGMNNCGILKKVMPEIDVIFENKEIISEKINEPQIIKEKGIKEFS